MKMFLMHVFMRGECRDEACVDRRSCANWQTTLNELIAGATCGVLLYLFSASFAVVIFGGVSVFAYSPSVRSTLLGIVSRSGWTAS